MAVIWLECYSFSVIGIFVEKVNSKAHKIAPKTKTELNQKLKGVENEIIEFFMLTKRSNSTEKQKVDEILPTLFLRLDITAPEI